VPSGTCPPKVATYADAVHVVLAADPELARVYAQPAARIAPMATNPAVPVPARAPLAQDRAPVALMDLVTHLDYQSAVNQVLAADPDLKAAYAEVQR
jgi:hypothetical protein